MTRSLPPHFFASAAEFRRWLQRNHRSATELWVGFYKKRTGRPSISWPEAVDEALCFGWIDGIRQRLDEDSYTNRFTPRRKGSIWSVVNTRRALDLIRRRRMRAAGRKAFDARDERKTAIYAFGQQSPPAFGAGLERRFKADRQAWAFFEAQPPGYRRLATWYVTSAKREETRAKRLDALIAVSASGRRLEPMQPASASALRGRATGGKVKSR